MRGRQQPNRIHSMNNRLMTAPLALPLSLLALLLLTACPAPPSDPPPSPTGDLPIAGKWRAVLASPGGDLPFTIHIRDDGGTLGAVVVNDTEEAPFSSVERQGNRVVLRFDWYDSEITAELDDTGENLAGTWRKTVPEGESTLPFNARLGDPRRFLIDIAKGPESPVADVSGVWAVELRDDDGVEAARGELVQTGNHVTGTFLTPTGDYRYLEGTYRLGHLRLSTFDGAHAFLFDARAQEDGSLEGDFWSRDTYHATWTARRAGETESILPDAWAVVGLTNDEGAFSFSFPDLDGRMVGLDDPRFAGKPVLVNIFGSWCPNCNDEAPLLAEWHRRYRDRGLEIVGLAYELTGDPERDRRLVRRFADRYGIEYPLLLAGVSDKEAAAATLPDLTAVIAYPTTIFIGRDGRVRKIHTGFSGPGTGSHYQQLVAELEAAIEELLAG